MKIRYASDLHIEFDWCDTPDFLPSIGEDLVVLAGDIGVGTQGIAWAAETFAGRDVVYVLGNHEFYGHYFDALVDQARDAAAATANVHLLENNALRLHGVRVLGCTLWTDFSLRGNPERAMLIAESMMADYRVIAGSHEPLRPLRPEQVRDRCRASRAWLVAELAASAEPTVVVTHTAPTGLKAVVNPRFIGDPLGPAFHNAFDDLLVSPGVAWIFGHHHYSFTREHRGVLLASNQRGYPGEGSDFDWERCLVIGVDGSGRAEARPAEPDR